ncbi:FMN-binding negative transcriptional regulator [Dokdonia sinensis]|uniref:FMN-binding negative transcriptional regulator n=1 Tax=Dokdonia sinensis TaxID=2479847 RepID=A0A3M0FVV5_9FLAO|nr:FMN-binding negative transcriptional regulator [Dokdonia sinensis]RMB56635.1 FMN-binding negative transcriptional regulator [Dokdonia sinensis]
MYIPEIYKNEDPKEIRDFLRANAFGILVTNKDGKSCATHIPLELGTRDDGTEILHGHISKVNEQVAHLGNGAEALCIFNGPHSYISASWYDFEEVSTWNYIAVQVRGTLKILDKEGVYKSIKALMDKYESGQKQPIDMDKLSEKTMRQINGVVGFEIEITSIEAAKKMSQNRDDKNHAAVVERLRENGSVQDKAVAEEMKKMRN